MNARLNNPAPLSFHTLIRWVYGLLLLSLPFSVGVDFGGFQINLPSEPLILLLSLLLALWFYRNGFFGRQIRRAPLTLAGIAWIAWMVISLPFSSQPLVSAKYVLVAAAHWWVFYLGLLVVVHKTPRDLFHYLLAYALPFTAIMLFAWTVHARYQFSIDTSVLVARPFYFDHALYSCCLLLLAGPFAIWAFKRPEEMDIRSGWLSGLLVILFLLGTWLSYSRAAWVSLLLSALLTGGIVLLKLRFRTLLLVLAAALLLFLILLPFLLRQAGENKAISKQPDLISQIISTANISTDVSNLERINRYSCAWRMFLDRPVFGFGAGTYQFAYLPYQRPEEMTRISVTDTGPHGPGRGGGAHSEYLQALSEGGLPGLIFWLALIIATAYSALAVFHRSERHKWLAIGILFSLFTYFIHGLFNNFLHHDKVAVLVWGLMAGLTAISIERQKMI